MRIYTDDTGDTITRKEYFVLILYSELFVTLFFDIYSNILYQVLYISI